MANVPSPAIRPEPPVPFGLRRAELVRAVCDALMAAERRSAPGFDPARVELPRLVHEYVTHEADADDPDDDLEDDDDWWDNGDDDDYDDEYDELDDELGDCWIAHDQPDRPFSFGMWLCECAACFHALRGEVASRPDTAMVLKTERDRIVVTARQLLDTMEVGPVELLCTHPDDRVREVFVGSRLLQPRRAG